MNIGSRHARPDDPVANIDIDRGQGVVGTSAPRTNITEGTENDEARPRGQNHHPAR
jgi:hypothetical protein